MPYRLLCLDAGFTLLSPRRTLADALSAVLAEDGHRITQEELRAAWEEADRWFWDEYHRPDNDTWSDDSRIEEYWRTYHGLMLERLGLDAHRELLDRVLASQFAPEVWEVYPDAEPMLREVRGMGLPVGVVSDWGSNLRDIVAQVGLEPYLDFVLASGAVGVAKPDPAFFRMACERVGVPPGAALMVGDSYRADVRGAWGAGMDAVWLHRSEGMTITPAQDLQPIPTDVHIIRTLAELPEIVRAGGPLPRGTGIAAEPAPSA